MRPEVDLEGLLRGSEAYVIGGVVLLGLGILVGSTAGSVLVMTGVGAMVFGTKVEVV